MAEEFDLSAKLAELDNIMSSTKLDKVTADNADEGFKELDEGYYLCEVENAEFTISKNSGNLMVKFTFKTIEDGIGTTVNDRGYVVNTAISRTKNRKIFKYYPMASESHLKRFVSDMMKFADHDDPTQPILPEEVYKDSAMLKEALSILIGETIYIQVTVTEKSVNGNVEKSSWSNLISWKRAQELELPN